MSGRGRQHATSRNATEKHPIIREERGVIWQDPIKTRGPPTQRSHHTHKDDHNPLAELERCAVRLGRWVSMLAYKLPFRLPNLRMELKTNA